MRFLCDKKVFSFLLVLMALLTISWPHHSMAQDEDTPVIDDTPVMPMDTTTNPPPSPSPTNEDAMPPMMDDGPVMGDE